MSLINSTVEFHPATGPNDVHLTGLIVDKVHIPVPGSNAIVDCYVVTVLVEGEPNFYLVRPDDLISLVKHHEHSSIS